ncbi:MAG: response regulator transcription factor [Bacteroidetes bacterium]|nr:response regulator transcription factor [Bacteroidota bacterium]
MKIYQIYLVDDHSIFLKGLSLLLNEVVEFKVIGEARNGMEFLLDLEHHVPDVVLMDIRMPGMNGIEATRLALEKIPGLNIIALTMFGEQKYYKLMAEAGARGFLQKDVTKDELVEAIKRVSDGESYFSHRVRSELAGNSEGQEGEDILKKMGEKLTEREVEVLHYLVSGLSAPEIADKMFISARTVEGHRASLISKTRTKNIVELVIFAIKNNLVSI